MKKLLAMLLAVTCVGLNTTAIHAEEPSNEYIQVVEAEDWGAAYTKLIVKMNGDESLNPEDYKVTTAQAIWGEPLTEGMEELTVTNIYESGADGNEGKGYITFELAIHPDYQLTNPYLFDFDAFYNFDKTVYFRVESTVTGSVWSQFGGQISEADVFEMGESTYEDEMFGPITLPYASFTPTEDDHKNALVVWLHGMGEGGMGGADPTKVLLGNEVVNFASDEYQEIFGGAYVFAPQAPSFWLDNGTGEFTTDGNSMYTGALMNAINEYVQANPDIDTDRIYIGGCSNGGFMTMNMLLNFPEYFAAAFPICEPYDNQWISKEQINAIRHIPMWFTQAANDELVNPYQNVVPTYKALKKAGAKDVHLGLIDTVTDTHGITYEDGETPYEYNGHFSWIYTLNNEITTDYDGKEVTDENGNPLTIMEWLASRTRQESTYEDPTFMDNFGTMIGSMVLVVLIVFGFSKVKGKGETK